MDRQHNKYTVCGELGDIWEGEEWSLLNNAVKQIAYWLHPPTAKRVGESQTEYHTHRHMHTAFSSHPMLQFPWHSYRRARHSWLKYSKSVATRPSGIITREMQWDCNIELTLRSKRLQKIFYPWPCIRWQVIFLNQWNIINKLNCMPELMHWIVQKK